MIPRHLLIGIALMLAVALGMSAYVWRMRGAAAHNTPTTADARPVPPPVAGPSEEVTLWIAYDAPGNVRPQGARIPLPSARQERAQELLRALVGLYLNKDSSHPLPSGSEVRDVYLVDPGFAVIDVNSALADGHRSGVLVEELTVASLVQTLARIFPASTGSASWWTAKHAIRWRGTRICRWPTTWAGQPDCAADAIRAVASPRTSKTADRITPL